MSLSSLVENLGKVYIQTETLKGQQKVAEAQIKLASTNQPEEVPRVKTGTNSNGQTLVNADDLKVQNQWIKGIDNTVVLGVGGLVSAIAIIVAAKAVS